MMELKGKDAVRVAAGVKACEGTIHPGRTIVAEEAKGTCVIKTY